MDAKWRKGEKVEMEGPERWRGGGEVDQLRTVTSES